jgi:hypothetical protein
MAKSKNVNLTNMFGAVTKELTANRQELNRADDYNHDHGDNMVEIFDTITKSTRAKKTAEPSEQLAYAAEMLGQRSNSGSAKIYQQGLINASREYKGKKIDSNNLMGLVSTLMGAEKPAKPAAQSGSSDMLGSLLSGMMGGGGQSGGGPDLGSLLGGGQSGKPSGQSGSSDMLGSLLSGMMGSGGGESGGAPDLADLLGGGQTDKPAPQSGSSDMLGSLLSGMMGGGAGQSDGGPDLGSLLGGGHSDKPSSQSGSSDMLGSLLSGMMGGGAAQTGGSTQKPDSGLDAADLLNAAMAYMNAKQKGQGTVEALLNAFVGSTQMSGTSHREQSSKIVLNTLLKLLSGAK